MVKHKVSHTISAEVLKKVETLQEKYYPGASRSYVIERLLRKGLRHERKNIDISVDRSLVKRSAKKD